MFVAIKSIGFADSVATADRQRLKASLAATDSLPGLVTSAVVDTMPSALNGGEFMWRAIFADEGAFYDCTESGDWRRDIAALLNPAQGVRVDAVGYEPRWSGVRDRGLNDGIWRLLLLSCDCGSTLEQWDAMERDHLLMPRYVPVIRNWAFGRVQQASGHRRWTHVWEQEFDDVGSLMGPYLHHPIHWGLVDRWYDIECPERIVDPWVVHAFGKIPNSILTAANMPQTGD